MSPVRLAKVEEKSLSDKIDDFVFEHIGFFLMLLYVMLMILIGIVMYGIMGVSATSTEANVYYYELNKVI